MKSIHLNIDLSFQQLVEVVKQLSPTKKLKLNEALWSDNNMNIPSEHQDLVLERMNKSKNSSMTMLYWEEASKTLNSGQIYNAVK
ncbi:MAG: hypothetical protein JWQ25_3080 [Daejeonella sp.]|nr:hypothetical protein [Daejeonella sp.]